jgi:hypothetical protein
MQHLYARRIGNLAGLLLVLLAALFALLRGG